MNIIHIFIAILFMEIASTYVIKSSENFSQKELSRKIENQEDLRNELTTEKAVEANVIDTTPQSENKIENETVLKNDNEKSCLTIFFSQVAQIFKQLFYGEAKPNNIELVEMEYAATNDDGNSREIPNHQDTLVNRFNITDPNAEVEIFEPRYHGRIRKGTKEEHICPEGSIMTPKGCTEKSSKLIISVPNQCPHGYRQDWLGFCRKMMFLE